MEISQETFLALWRKYQGQTITIHVPPYPNDTDQPTPDPVTKPLTDYDYSASDAAGHEGEWYLLLHSSLTGNVSRTGVSVGGVSYRFDRIYKGGELYYGKTATGTIKVVCKDGTTYVDEYEKAQAGNKTLKLRYHGRYNGDRPTWYSDPPTKSFAAKVRVIVAGCSDFEADYNGHRWEGGGWIIKESDVAGRGLTVVGPSSCKSTVARLEY